MLTSWLSIRGEKVTSIKTTTFFLTLAIASAWATAGQAALINVYSNNFDGSETFGGGATGGLSGSGSTEPIAGLPTPFSGNLLRNSSTTPTTLSLANLPSHASVDINFDLVFIDSWDSTDGFGYNTWAYPDYFNVNVDGSNVLQTTCNNTSGTVCYSGTQIGTAHTNYGWDANYVENAFDLGSEPLLTMSHTGSTLTIDIFGSGAGYQGGADESWGIDNLNVVLRTVGDGQKVPEPATLGLFGIGLAGLGWAARKRKTR